MQKITKSILGILVVIGAFLATTAFIMSDSQADFTKQSVRLHDQFSLAAIDTKNVRKGSFKSSVKFTKKAFDHNQEAFYGQVITITNNPHVDKILIGITNNLISRIEIRNQNKLIESKEMGFMNKMTWGDIQTMSVEFYDQTNGKHKGKSNILMHFYERTGFFGDIGTISFDLTKFGDLRGDKSIGVFAQTNDANTMDEPMFFDLKIWKDYNSVD